MFDYYFALKEDFNVDTNGYSPTSSLIIWSFAMLIKQTQANPFVRSFSSLSKFTNGSIP